MASSTWRNQAIQIIAADLQRSAETHLIKLSLPALAGIDIYLKDESTHPTGSLKHRLARSLFLYALCNGWIQQDTPIIEASSGSTAVSEAYFAQLLGLPFIAVMAKTGERKITAFLSTEDTRSSSGTIYRAKAGRRIFAGTPSTA